MSSARAVVSKALEARDAAKIKVRQPLRLLIIPANREFSEEYLKIIADEVNVKTVEKKGDSVVLDTNLTDELREEGIIRDAVRAVQEARKAAKLKPGERGKVSISVPAEDRSVVEKNLALIQKQTNTDIEFTD
jgi:isoleucyl-tRNA synthetase